ncbi:putative Regulatory protein LuxR [uncultured Sphingopyxis sp.]|uniref:Putative Regulatory protein LuxR n=1 Tax=uncultured Sphingopyxis sp. TaxID=310581 RepID=A0A1Y5PP89_9SPHN|nr:LuxR C-terminal-related transcriptional regulator [uncultured Sphingopyxis sp.]SBV31791.1 putative Regulatory protein LuxR [uncultured Sphingopyxis sp.]
MLSVEEFPGRSTSPLRKMATLVSAIGQDEFATSALDALDEAVGVDHLSLLRINAKGDVDFRAATSVGGSHLSDAVSREYFHRFTHLDPVRSVSRRRMVPGGYLLVRVTGKDVLNASYRQACYTNPDIGERLTIFSRVNGLDYQINLYRVSSRGRFGEDAPQFLSGVAEILLPAIMRHADLISGPGEGRVRRLSLEALEHRVRRLNDKLSDREIDVCSRMLYGQSIEGTALDLEISQTSVVTYRRRAYAKLGITCHNELFALAM